MSTTSADATWGSFDTWGSMTLWSATEPRPDSGRTQPIDAGITPRP